MSDLAKVTAESQETRVSSNQAQVLQQLERIVNIAGIQ